MNYLDLITKRRSIYQLAKNVTLSQDEITELIKTAIRQAPSSFNSQNTRAVILFNQQHDIFWEIVKQSLAKIVAAEKFAATEQKINGFKAAYATVLFFEELNTLKQLQQDFPSYAEHFPLFSQHAIGIAQFSTWLALAENNLGASLQHYNPIIDAQVKQQWQLPDSWLLSAQMPLGSIEQAAGEKTYLADAERFRVIK